MPVWGWIALGAGVVLALALIALGYVFAARAARKRALLGLVSRREGITAVGQSLEGVVVRLAESDDETLHAFAVDADNVERHVLAETAARAFYLADDLDTRPMPRSLVPVAEALADAAYVVGEQAGKVEDGMSEDEVLDAVSSIDLEHVRTIFGKARSRLGTACEACRLDEQSVYGGGLYL